MLNFDELAGLLRRVRSIDPGLADALKKAWERRDATGQQLVIWHHFSTTRLVDTQGNDAVKCAQALHRWPYDDYVVVGLAARVTRAEPIPLHQAFNPMNIHAQDGIERWRFASDYLMSHWREEKRYGEIVDVIAQKWGL